MVHLVEIVEMYGNYLIDDRDLTRIPDLSLVSHDFQDSQLRISFFLKAKLLHLSFHWFLQIFERLNKICAIPLLR